MAIGDLPSLLSLLRSRWKEGHDESAAIIGVCKAVEMAASGTLVSLREAAAIAEGLDIRARARTPMISGTFGPSHHAEEDPDYDGFKAAAELMAERQQMQMMGLSPDHDPSNAHSSAAISQSPNNGKPGHVVRR